MATDRIADAQLALGNRSSANASLAADLKGGRIVFSKTAADNDGSVIRVFPNVPVEDTISNLGVINDAIAGLTSVSAGIYNVNGGAVLSSTLFSSAVSLAAGNAITAPANMLQGVAIANLGLNIRDLYKAVTGNDLSVSIVDIVLTLTTAGTNTGNLAVTSTAHVQ